MENLSQSRLGIHSSLLPGKLDDGRSNGWLDAIISSSPPRKKMLKDFEMASDDRDIGYISWVMKHPSAINSFEQIISCARNKKIVMFLDYDGTLSPIVDNPDCAFMFDEMRSVVRNLAKHVPTAIISGRSRDKVYELVGLTELYYAGSHGMDILCPVGGRESVDPSSCIKTTDQQGKEVNLFQPARDFLPVIDEIFRTLVENTKDIKGAKVENHKFCASVHYRNVDEKVLEVRPVINWNKGKAVEFLLDSLGLSKSDDVLPVYIGDDKTDEDAFKVLREGYQGYGILVSSVPKETKAVFSLKDPLEVKQFLNCLVRWKGQSEVEPGLGCLPPE